MNTFGTRLREARKDAGLSQPALAQKVGLSQTTISDIERGRNAGSTEAAALAAVLGVNALWLAEGKGPKHPGGKDVQPSPALAAESHPDIAPEVAALLATITGAAGDGTLTPEQAAAFDQLIKTTTTKK